MGSSGVEGFILSTEERSRIQIMEYMENTACSRMANVEWYGDNAKLDTARWLCQLTIPIYRSRIPTNVSSSNLNYTSIILNKHVHTFTDN